ncbi:MAG: extracellular solute-binding protein, partial [bacterium]
EGTIKLGEPNGLAALQRIYESRFVTKTSYSTIGPGAQGGKDMTTDLFCQGKVGIMGPVNFFMKNIKGQTKIKWDVVPMPNINRKKGSTSTETYPTTSIAIAWAVAAESKHPKEAYKFIRYISGPKGQTMLAERGLLFPVLQSVANSPAFLQQPEAPAHMDNFIKASQNAVIPYWPRIKPFLGWFVNDLGEYTLYGRNNPEKAVANLTRDWAAEQASPRNKPRGVPIGGTTLLIMLIVALALVIGTLIYLITQQRGGRMAKQEMRSGLLFISPWLIGFVVFVLGPMVLSLVLSLTQWQPILPLENARVVGFDNYRELFTTDAVAQKSMRVTLLYTILVVPFSQIIALTLASLLVVKLKTISFFRSMYFMPSLIGGVVMASIGLRLFDNKAGMLNAILRPILGIFHAVPPDWLGIDAAKWAIPGLVLLSLWGVGGSMLIYLAALKGVSPELHESASLDGASSWDKFIHITLPMISPIIQFNVIMSIIGSFKIFDVVRVMTSGGPNNETMVYALQLFSQAFGALNMGYASAMAWVLFVIILLVTLLVFRAMRDRVYYESLK